MILVGLDLQALWQCRGQMVGLHGHGSTGLLASPILHTNPHLDGQVGVVQELELRGLVACFNNSCCKVCSAGPAQSMVVAHNR